MCNYRHETKRNIPLEGKGWKIFGKPSTNRGYVRCFGAHGYTVSRDGWIHWDSLFEYGGDGFCFFPTRKEARRCLKTLKDGSLRNIYRDRVIRRIEYREGIEEHDEDKICAGTYRTCLAKQFRILEG
jgi:hypothetical protein